MTLERRDVRLDLTDLPNRASERAVPDGIIVRPVRDDDDPALGALMEAAYAGTIDDDLGDNDDGAVEIAGWRALGGDARASRAAEDSAGALVGATLITSWEGRAYLSYVYTAPAYKDGGVATATAAAALAALHDRGVGEVEATVTVGNTASERLLAGLGFA